MQLPTQQQTASTDSIPASNGQPAQFPNENHAPYAPAYQQIPPVNNRDTNGQTLPHLFAGLNLHNQRPGAKMGPIKGNLPLAVAPFDFSGPRTMYNGQFVYLPNGSLANGPLFNGMPQVPSFAPTLPGHDQLGQFPYLSTGMYPSVNPGCSVVPGAVPGYPLPYLVNGEVQDQTGQKKNSWSSNEESKISAPASSDAQQEYYTNSTVPSVEGSNIPNYPYSIPQQLGPACLPLQMMKTPTGYALQDLEALTQQEPSIPRAVPAMWTNPSEMTLAKCLENREGITNVYIRGFLPETTDEMLHDYASRFGKIDRCKAIVDLDSGLCKGFGFVQYFNFESCENCIRGFFYLGYQASFAQKSRNSRLKDLEDKMSTNIYCTNLPIDWTEADLRNHFEPYRVVSEKISRDEKTGVSKEVGFARFETRDIAEKVLGEFHNVAAGDGVKLLLRFADTKAQKMLKHQSNERRAYRAGEYSYSVEVVQGSTPSPSLHRLRQTASHISPNSQLSYASPLGVGSTWTPATSISPSCALMKNPASGTRFNPRSTRNSPNALEDTPVYRGRLSSVNRNGLSDNISAGSGKSVLPSTPCSQSKSQSKSESCSPQKQRTRSGSTSPSSSREEIIVCSPRSLI